MSDVKKFFKDAAIQVGSGGSAGKQYCLISWLNISNDMIITLLTL